MTKQNKQRRAIPLWLRKLGQVKSELRGSCWPRTVEAGVRETAALSEIALQSLKQEAQAARQKTDIETIRKRMQEILARASRMDAQRMALWKKERARFFR
ncbi:MAG: hypothetical protein HY204_03090 [Nitrospirae bacterium]|nr:hypothetical protein [Nitrospirota bacterium]